jgi:CheY-like chemotaxis protein
MARILVVDDDADVRELIELALAGEGHEVDSETTGRLRLEASCCVPSVISV